MEVRGRSPLRGIFIPAAAVDAHTLSHTRYATHLGQSRRLRSHFATCLIIYNGRGRCSLRLPARVHSTNKFSFNACNYHSMIIRADKVRLRNDERLLHWIRYRSRLANSHFTYSGLINAPFPLSQRLPK
jgi:hypothetical protein